jgi:hypothetical protein
MAADGTVPLVAGRRHHLGHGEEGSVNPEPGSATTDPMGLPIMAGVEDRRQPGIAGNRSNHA